MLDLDLVLTLARTCAPQVAPTTLAAVAWTESRFDPLAIGVNRGPRPARRPRTAPEAAQTARDLLARGANLDLGLAQINSANLAWLNLSVEDAFDPCRNLAASATVLRAGYRPADDGPAGRQAALRIALSRYNTGHPERGFRNGYVGRVERAAADLSGAPIPAAPPPLADTPAPPTPEPTPPSWDVFGRARVSVTVVFGPAPAWSQP